MKGKSIKRKIIEATPLLCTFVYLLIGFVWGIWHPTWAIFFLIILVPIILRSNFLRLVYPMICVGVYLGLGFWQGWWHPAWIIFLTIPIFNILFEPRRKEKTEYIEYSEVNEE